MNSHYQKSKNRNRGFAKAQAAVEMAAVAPVLALLLLAATDFGRLYYTNIEVAGAARAGAQYGSQSVITAADPNGMKTAAQNDASNIPGMTATATQCTCIATCIRPACTVAACPTSYCTSSPTGTFVEVDTSTTFNTLVSYPGIPHSVALSGKAVMLVAQ